MSTSAVSTPACPKCGGEMWDERLGKFWGTGLSLHGKNKPTFKCKTKSCAENGGVVFALPPVGTQSEAKETGGAIPATAAAHTRQSTAPPDGVGAKSAEGTQRPPHASQPGAPASPADVSTHPSGAALYRKIAKWYLDEILPLYIDAGVPVTHEGCGAGIAALYIQANKHSQ